MAGDLQRSHDKTLRPPSFTAQQELCFFESIRDKLGEPGQDLYHEFIKCLSLFAQEIISRQELLMLAEELFSVRPGLFDLFKGFLDSAGTRGLLSAHEPNLVETYRENGTVPRVSLAREVRGLLAIEFYISSRDLSIPGLLLP